jgi:putative aldouronate transport system substrate-binding protein
MKSKVIALLIAVTLFAGLMVSCGAPSGPEPVDKDNAEGKLFTSSTELSILVGSHPSWPYNPNYVFWKYFKEATGATLNVTSIPNTEFSTKLSLLMATPKELPDLIHIQNKATADQYSAQGALVAIDDYLDMMPNYTAFWNSLPERERNAFLIQRLGPDGKTYFPQVYGYDRVMNLQVWMYRKDIFEKNGLTPPETFDEVYETAKKLKEIYPDSYPVAFRGGLGKINLIGTGFKPYFAYDLYYDFPNGKWSYGATEPVMLDIVNYFRKLRDASLVPPDYLTIATKSWEEIISTDRGFMMPEYMVRFDFFNLPNRKRDPEYTWTIMKPPGVNKGENKIAKLNSDPTGYVICNTGDKTRIENSIKLLDWMYSDEAAELLSWGKEGETFTYVDGQRRFITEEGENPTAKYGVMSYGLYQRLDPAAVTVAYSDEQAAMTDEALSYLDENINPINWLALTADEASRATDLRETLKTYADEMLSRFLMGHEPISKWDSFVSEIKSIGTDELLEIYETAYSRVTKK